MAAVSLSRAEIVDANSPVGSFRSYSSSSSSAAFALASISASFSSLACSKIDFAGGSSPEEFASSEMSPSVIVLFASSGSSFSFASSSFAASGSSFVCFARSRLAAAPSSIFFITPFICSRASSCVSAWSSTKVFSRLLHGSRSMGSFSSSAFAWATRSASFSSSVLGLASSSRISTSTDRIFDTDSASSISESLAGGNFLWMASSTSVRASSCRVYPFASCTSLTTSRI